MGRVVARIKLQNSGDLRLARDGLLPPERVRTLELEALVDTGATDLVLPADVVAELGLPEIDRRSRELKVNPASPDIATGDLLLA